MKKLSTALLFCLSLGSMTVFADTTANPLPTQASSQEAIHLADWSRHERWEAWCNNHPRKCHREWCANHPGACANKWCDRHPQACRSKWCANHPKECR